MGYFREILEFLEVWLEHLFASLPISLLSLWQIPEWGMEDGAWGIGNGEWVMGNG
jgi:hypothetical protein